MTSSGYLLAFNRFPLLAMGSAILQAPLWAFAQGILPFLLFKHLGISPTLFGLFLALKPVSGLLAPYWQLFGRHSPIFIHRNLSWSCWLAGLPFLLGFWIETPIFWVVATGWFLILAKGRQGAWAELLRGQPESAVRVVGIANSVGYGLGMVLPFLGGYALDACPDFWPLLPLGAGSLMIASGFLQTLVPQQSHSCSPSVHLPLKTALSVFQRSPLFFRYQLAMMLAGSGLMVIQPAIPSLLMDRFALGYADCALIFGCCKALGYVVSNRLWTRVFFGKGVIRLSANAAWLSFLFLLSLAIASNPVEVGGAYLLYGCMQGASELAWQLCPVEFGRNASALPYTSAATFLMGLRGLFVPFLGTFLFAQTGLQGPLALGAALTLIGAVGFSLLISLQGHQAGDTTYRSRLSPENLVTK